jgi:hypothetical protein
MQEITKTVATQASFTPEPEILEQDNGILVTLFKD